MKSPGSTHLPGRHPYARTPLRLALLIAVIALSVCGQATAAAPVPPSVQAAIDNVQAKPEYRHSLWGLSVMDRDTGEVLIDQFAGKMFVPGSTMKLFTASAAMARLGANHRFRTPVHRTGSVRRGRLDGDLVLVASGDFSFGLRERANGRLGFNSFPEIDHNYADTGLPGPALLKGSRPLAGVDDLARKVRRSGIRQVDGDVLIDDRMFREYTGWTDGKISSIWINENVIDMVVRPTRPGQRARVSWRPKTAALRVVNRTTTGPAGSESSLEVDGPTGGQIILRGRIPADSTPVLNIAQIPDPAAFARTAFIEALRRQGVSVPARATGPNPEGDLPRRRSLSRANRVALRTSYRFSEYVKVILKVSYNRGAHLLVCLLAAERGSRNCYTGLYSVVANNRALGAPPITTLPFDGAGSDDRDRTAPAVATTFLRNLHARPYGATMFDSMSIFGVDGTAALLGRGTPAAGKIRLKDGARVAFVRPDGRWGFAGARAHFGYVQAASGRQLVFANYFNDVPLSQPTDFFKIDDDLAAVEVAIQQGY